MIRIVIADDHKIFAETLGSMLRLNADFEVIAICLNSEEAMETIRAQKPDIALMDINIKPLSGVEATLQLAAFSSTKVIGLSMHSDPSYSKKMFNAGAAGYVTKNSPMPEIFTAIREVAMGNEYICNDTKQIIAEELTNAVAEEVSDKKAGDTEAVAGKTGKPVLAVSNTGNSLLQKIGKLHWLGFRKNSA